MPDVSWWLLYGLTLAAQVISVFARVWLFAFVAYPVCWLLGWPTGQLETIALAVALAPLAWSLLALVWSMDWFTRQRSGAREPSEREQQILDATLALLASDEPALPRRVSIVVVDVPDSNAWVLGRQVTIERGLLEHHALAAVLAYELGHVKARDGVHTLVINRLQFLPSLLLDRPQGHGILRGLLRALTTPPAASWR